MGRMGQPTGGGHNSRDCIYIEMGKGGGSFANAQSSYDKEDAMVQNDKAV